MKSGIISSIQFDRKQIIIKFVLILFFSGICIPTSSVSADIAPPQQPPGANLSPANEFTQVRMMEETVIMNLLPETDITKMGNAEVWAEFLMKNLGDEAETLLVRFPISANDGHYNYPEITDFRVYADGTKLNTDPLQMPGEHGDTIQWVHFEVDFPPGAIVELVVEYTLDGSGEYPFVSYAYLLETGAGWKDSIGSADIIVNLPYPATPKTVFIDSSPGWGQTTSGAKLEGNQVKWHFEDLEPTNRDNISIAMVWPSAWEKVKIESQRIADNPMDGEAWGRLGKVYKELGFLRKWFRNDPGGEELFQLSLEAYEYAVELLPEDALWHAGLGELLYWKYDWFVVPITEESRAGYIRALEEFHIAYNLDPDHPFIRTHVEDKYFHHHAIYFDGDEYEFLWLTATPTLPPQEETATPTPNIAPEQQDPTATETQSESAPTSTNIPAKTEGSEIEEPGRKISLPICGSLILIPLLAVLPLIKPIFFQED